MRCVTTPLLRALASRCENRTAR
uniref:Uncharacterized protein n=1 Tax=Anguilla anguilla TaxID=7936 RepID=A0A0E9TMN2_ANGAN